MPDDQVKKRQPGVAPPRDALRERLSLALTDEALQRPFSVKLSIHGGLPSQGYHFDFSAAGDGSAYCRMSDQLKKRDTGRREAQAGKAVASKDFQSLLAKVDRAMAAPAPPPRFLPDTLVGILEISDGEHTQRILFAADPEQAKTMGLPPPAEVKAAVDAIYALSAKLTGMKNVKP